MIPEQLTLEERHEIAISARLWLRCNDLARKRKARKLRSDATAAVIAAEDRRAAKREQDRLQKRKARAAKKRETTP